MHVVLHPVYQCVASPFGAVWELAMKKSVKGVQHLLYMPECSVTVADLHSYPLSKNFRITCSSSWRRPMATECSWQMLLLAKCIICPSRKTRSCCGWFGSHRWMACAAGRLRAEPRAGHRQDACEHADVRHSGLPASRAAAGGEADQGCGCALLQHDHVRDVHQAAHL